LSSKKCKWALADSKRARGKKNEIKRVTRARVLINKVVSGTTVKRKESFKRRITTIKRMKKRKS